MLKCGLTVLLSPLTQLFNRILSSGKYPSEWCLGYICPIYKKGNKEDPLNYRGLTINSCVGKVFTKVLNNRLEFFFTKKGSYIS